MDYESTFQYRAIRIALNVLAALLAYGVYSYCMGTYSMPKVWIYGSFFVGCWFAAVAFTHCLVACKKALT